MSDRAAEFVREFTKHSRRIYRSIRAVLPREADAEDVFQETSATLWEKFDEFEPGTNFGAWAARVTHFKVLSYRQKQGRQTQLFSDETVEAIAVESERMAASIDARQQYLTECLEHLQKRDRQLLQQRYSPGETIESVAGSLGRSAKTAYRVLARIHQQLLECVLRKLKADAESARPWGGEAQS